MPPVVIPVDLADSSPDSLRRWSELCALMEEQQRRIWGDGAGRVDPVTQRALMLSNPDRTTTIAVVEEDGHVVAVAMVLHDRNTSAEARVGVDVALAHRRRGLGGLLLDCALDAASTLGASRVGAGVDHGAEHNVAGEAFATAAGFRQIQDIVVSEAHLTDIAPGAAPAGYVIHTWLGKPPENHHADLARLTTRMSTDAPRGDAEPVADVWDAERIRARHERLHAAGVAMVTALAVHEESGEAVGFSDAVHHSHQADMLHQGDTLVVPEHRGHGLGMAIKRALIAHARAELPGVTRTRTSNAAENAPMLAVNEALGYRPVGAFTRWQRDL